MALVGVELETLVFEFDAMLHHSTTDVEILCRIFSRVVIFGYSLSSA